MTFGPGDPPPGSPPVAFMMARLGMREPSPWIDRALALCGIPEARPTPAWCAAAIVSCCLEAKVILPRIAGVRRLADAISGRRIAEPEPGCVALHFSDDGIHGHALFWLAHNEDGSDATVSGNTNAAGSRNGDRIGLHDRERAYFNGGFYHVDRDPFRVRR